MTFVADESLDGQIIEAVRGLGHEVRSIAETTPAIPDLEVLEIARHASAILLTGDKDFGELVYRLGQLHGGVVLVRPGHSPETKALLVAAAILEHEKHLENAFCVVTKKLIRIRRRG